MKISEKSSANEEPREKRTIFETTSSLLAGALSGACAKTVIAPFCRLRINFQISSNQVFSTKAAIDYMRQTHQLYGFAHLFRGNSIMVVRCMPFSAIHWASFEHYKHQFQVDENGIETPYKRFLVGVLAAMTSTCFTYPLDVANARLATNPSYKNLFGVLTDGFRMQGLRSFYRGLTPTLAGTIPYSGTIFFVQATLKLEYEKLTGKKPGSLLQLLSGGIAGLFGVSLAYPLDTVRRRMQTNNVPTDYGIIKTFQYIYQQEGLTNGIYKGIRVNFFTVPVASAIYFFSYDKILSNIQQLMGRHG